MPISWLSWKKSLATCKSEPAQVHDPQRAATDFTIFDTIKLTGCSRSMAHLKDVIHGSRRVIQTSSASSPLSVQSCDVSSGVNLEAVLRNRDLNSLHKLRSSSNLGLSSAAHHHKGPRFGSCYDCKGAQNPAVCSLVYRSTTSQNCTPQPAFSSSSSINPVCQKCGEIFLRYDALENHHLALHAVMQLTQEDSSRSIVEIIFRTSWQKSEVTIQRILKVQNMQRTLALFEDYRDMVKTRASRLTKKHPRCVADGNELLRFYGTTVVCTLGMNGSSSLCTQPNCNMCRILRSGFVEAKKERKGIMTTATSGEADEYIESDGGAASKRRAMLVCRVIAGRIRKCHNSSNCSEGLPTGFDSMAGNMASPHSNIEELHVFNPKAILPCFIVIYAS